MKTSIEIFSNIRKNRYAELMEMSERIQQSDEDRREVQERIMDTLNKAAESGSLVAIVSKDIIEGIRDMHNSGIDLNSDQATLSMFKSTYEELLDMLEAFKKYEEQFDNEPEE